MLVHDMGQNWELVSDALNSIVQLKVIYYYLGLQSFLFFFCHVNPLFFPVPASLPCRNHFIENHVIFSTSLAFCILFCQSSF